MSSQPGRLSAFGIPNEDEPGPADDIFAKDLGAADADSPAPDPQTPEIPDPALDQQPETTTVEAEAPPEVEAAAPEEGEPAAETPPEEILYAGKYTSVENLEKGYRESSREAQQIRAQLLAKEREHAELAEAVQNYLAEQQRQQAPAAAPQAAPDLTDAELAQMGIDRPTYQVLKPLVERLVTSQVDPIRAQNEQLAQSTQLTQQQLESQRAQAEQQAEMANVQQTLGAFYASHPEYASGTEGNATLGELISQWNSAWTGDPSGLAAGSFNVADPIGLEIAAEAAKRPALARILEANPSWFETDAGMDLARQQATVLEATARAQRQQQPASKTGQALPQVESGASGSGPRPLDTQPRTPVEAMLADAQSERSESIFARG